jgi:UDP-glucose-4-epimerase GalE
MSAVVVTGGAGYVGSHAVKALAAAGRDVVVYDDLSAGHTGAVARLAKAFPARRITLVRGDIRDRAAVAAALRASSATAVLHFAARLLVGESVADPIGYYRANVEGSMTLLEAMAETGISCLVFSSTAATFGEPRTVPIDEDHPQDPINPYGETKLAVERALGHVERATGIRSVTLRYFNAAGADPEGLIGEDHDPEEHLIPLVIRAARTGAPVTVFGDDYDTPDGTCVRDYVHVADLADAHVSAVAHLEAGGASRAFNLGNGVGSSVREVIAMVQRHAKRDVPYAIGARRPGDPARLVASSSRAERDLNWRRRLSALDSIVGTAWAWHEKHPRGYGDRG